MLLPFQQTLKRLSFVSTYTQMIKITQDLFGHQAQIQQQTSLCIALLSFPSDHLDLHLSKSISHGIKFMLTTFYLVPTQKKHY